MVDELRPPKRRDMPPRRQEQRRTHLVRELRADRSRRRRWRPLIVVPAVLAVVASGAFAATRIFDDKETTDYFVVDCYEAPSLDSPSQDAFADLIAPPGQQPGDRTPAEMCAELWDAGELGSGKIVPRLASCLAHGEVAVLPGDPRTCDALGLRELPASYQAGAARFTELIERSADVLAECTTRDELATRLTAVYMEFGRDPSKVATSRTSRFPAGTASADGRDRSASFTCSPTDRDSRSRSSRARSRPPNASANAGSTYGLAMSGSLSALDQPPAPADLRIRGARARG